LAALFAPVADNLEKQVFINCPFDPGYRATFDAIVFAVLHCGFEPRSALEAGGSGQQRFDRLLVLIGACPLAIHDLSRVELSGKNLPRFNMPFELGLFSSGGRLWVWNADEPKIIASRREGRDDGWE
jgi:hypothetical protein